MIAIQIEKVRKLQLIELINKRIDRMQLTQEYLKELVSRQIEDSVRLLHVQKQVSSFDERLEREVEMLRKQRGEYRAYIDDVAPCHDLLATAASPSSSYS